MTRLMLDSLRSTSNSEEPRSQCSVILPNLSLLTDRDKLRPSSVTESIADNLSKTGYGVDWKQGVFQVSVPPAWNNPVIDFDMLGPRSGYRQRVSSLTMRKAKDKHEASSRRPSTCPPQSQHGASQAARVSRFQGISAPPDDPMPTRMSVPSLSSPSLARGPSTPMRASTPSIATFSSYAPPQGPSTPTYRPITSHERPAVSPARPATSPVQGQGLPAQTAVGIRTGFKHAFANKPNKRIFTELRPSAVVIDSPPPAVVPAELNGGNKVVVPPAPAVVNIQKGLRRGTPVVPITRGHILMVFNEMDRDKNGKLTRSEFEESAISLGFSLEQSTRMFDMMDDKGKGFLQPSDWGRTDQQHVTEGFTLMYMRKYLGLPDVSATQDQVKRYNRLQQLREVKSLAAAVKMVRVNVITRGARGGGISGNPVFEAFRFIDADGSGDLDRDEMRDALFALGVFASEEVLDQIMTSFDCNNQGAVNYHDFVRKLFPASAGSL